MTSERLTEAQRRLLTALADDENTTDGWMACEMGHSILTANNLKRMGAVEIDLGPKPWFDCRITPAGRALLEGEGK